MKSNIIVLIVVLLLLTAVGVGAGYQTLMYMTDGGDRQVVASGGQVTVESGGEIEVESGGTIDVESGGIFNLVGRMLVLTKYAGDPNADSLDVEITGLDATDMAMGTLSSHTSGAVYVERIVPRADTARVYLNTDPGISINVSILTAQD